MFTKNNFFNIISSFIIAFAVLFSGAYSTHIQVDSADSYAHKQESEAVIEAIDIQIAYVDMATTEATGICNNSYVQQIVGQNICVKKFMDAIYHNTSTDELVRFSFNSYMAQHAIENLEQFFETVVLNYIHSMDGKKRI